jgi:hypothetical protein
MPDDSVILPSDILPTAWHANELGEVGQGDRVAIWGAGPGALSKHRLLCRLPLLLHAARYRLHAARKCAAAPGSMPPRAHGNTNRYVAHPSALRSAAVGLLAAHCAFARGAERVVLIDREEMRLQFARDNVKNGRVETINIKGGWAAGCNCKSGCLQRKQWGDGRVAGGLVKESSGKCVFCQLQLPLPGRLLCLKN